MPDDQSNDVVLENQVELLGMDEDDFWDALRFKGVSRECRECREPKPCEMLLRTSDSGIPVRTDAHSIKVDTGTIYLNSAQTVAICCPNCGNVRWFSLKVLKSG